MLLTAVFVLGVLNLVCGVIAIWQRQQTINAMRDKGEE